MESSGLGHRPDFDPIELMWVDLNVQKALKPLSGSNFHSADDRLIDGYK